jgi:phosphodiesterase/alkaline phosphatase D-like protein
MSIRTLRALPCALVLSCGLALTHAGELPSRVAAGDVHQNGAVLWAKATVLGDVTFRWDTNPVLSGLSSSGSVSVAELMAPAKLPVTGLQANTLYYYDATDAAGNRSSGTFRTPAPANVRRGLRLGASGDWRGELAPYPAVSNVPAASLDTWISLGDTIYGDVASPDLPIPQAMTLSDYRIKNNEVYSPRYGLNTLADVRASAGILAVIDDHEVTNDFAGNAPPASMPLFAGFPQAFISQTPIYRNGLQAFTEYNPIRSLFIPPGDPKSEGRPDLYRVQRHGRDASIFLTDARSFRDIGLPAANPLDQSSVITYVATSFTPGRGMLGAHQIGRLKADLLQARDRGVLWKFIVVSQPVQNLGVLNASDRYEGYTAERNDLLRFIDLNNIRNVVFVTADFHGTLVNDVTYNDGPFQPQKRIGAFEVITGSVAYDAPFGPTVAGLAFGLGLPGTLPPAVYAGLPIAQKEAYIQGLINAQVAPLGYSPIGIDAPAAGGDIDATLLAGAYSASNTYGWTAFDIDAASQSLTVTTFGIQPYTKAELDADPSGVTGRVPSVVSRFVVNPYRCDADFTFDGLVDDADFVRFADAYNQMFTPPASPLFDLNADGLVDDADFGLFVTGYEALVCP